MSKILKVYQPHKNVQKEFIDLLIGQLSLATILLLKLVGEEASHSYKDSSKKTGKTLSTKWEALDDDKRSKEILKRFNKSFNDVFIGELSALKTKNKISQADYDNIKKGITNKTTDTKSVFTIKNKMPDNTDFSLTITANVATNRITFDTDLELLDKQIQKELTELTNKELYLTYALNVDYDWIPDIEVKGAPKESYENKINRIYNEIKGDTNTQDMNKPDEVKVSVAGKKTAKNEKVDEKSIKTVDKHSEIFFNILTKILNILLGNKVKADKLIYNLNLENDLILYDKDLHVIKVLKGESKILSGKNDNDNGTYYSTKDNTIINTTTKESVKLMFFMTKDKEKSGFQTNNSGIIMKDSLSNFGAVVGDEFKSDSVLDDEKLKLQLIDKVIESLYKDFNSKTLFKNIEKDKTNIDRFASLSDDYKKMIDVAASFDSNDKVSEYININKYKVMISQAKEIKSNLSKIQVTPGTTTDIKATATPQEKSPKELQNGESTTVTKSVGDSSYDTNASKGKTSDMPPTPKELLQSMDLKRFNETPKYNIKDIKIGLEKYLGENNDN